MKARILIDLRDTVKSTLLAQSIREGRKLKPYLEHLLTEKAKEIDREFQPIGKLPHENREKEPVEQLTAEEIHALKRLLSAINANKSL